MCNTQSDRTLAVTIEFSNRINECVDLTNVNRMWKENNNRKSVLKLDIIAL